MGGMTHGPGDIGDLAEPPTKAVLKITGSNWLFLKAVDDGRKFRNYMKARKRSIRNSRGGR